MQEIWKDIIGYEGRYQVSNWGRVKSLISNKLMSPINNGNGYLYVTLCNNGKRKNRYIHRLVAEAFIENTDNKKEVNHKNGDKSKNTVENLEWVTPKENQIHSSKVLKTKYNLTGLNKSREKQKKKVCSIDNKGKIIKIYDSISEAGRENKVKPSCICGCCKGIYKTCRGMKWKYLN